MRSGMRKELWLCANGNILGCAVIWRKVGARSCGYAPMDDGCAVNHVLSCDGFLGYLKDCNVAAHSVDSDIFYVVINLSAGSKS